MALTLRLTTENHNPENHNAENDSPGRSQLVGKVGNDTAGQRNVARLDHNAGGGHKALNNRQQRIGGQGGGFIG